MPHKNKEDALVAFRATRAAYRAANPGKIAAYHATYRAANRKMLAAKNAAYRAAHPEKFGARDDAQRKKARARRSPLNSIAAPLNVAALKKGLARGKKKK